MLGVKFQELFLEGSQRFVVSELSSFVGGFSFPTCEVALLVF